MQHQGRELSPTRSAAVAMRDEYRLIREGYQFLDEKSVQLAAEIMRQLTLHHTLEGRYRKLHATSQEAVGKALGRHGLDGLSVFPALDISASRVQTQQRRFLGVRLQEASLASPSATTTVPPVNPSPEARSCATLFHSLAGVAVELAAVSGNLQRLVREYRETERRARALENVLIPEITSALKEIEEHLETAEQEEAVLVRHARPIR